MVTNMRWALLAAAAVCASGFGIDDTDADVYVIDTGADLKFTVRRTVPDPFTGLGSSGGISSLMYKDVEYVEAGGRYSSINDGFHKLFTLNPVVEVTAEEVVAGETIKVTVATESLTHYYIVKKGEAKIYMGTHWTEKPQATNQ
ncbi:hypothetical protein DIPPA_17881a, partial [Diplonema papillatum]